MLDNKKFDVTFSYILDQGFFSFLTVRKYTENTLAS